MGSVKKRPDGTWRARWREYPGGPEHAKHFDLKEQATRWVNQMENDKTRGVYVDPRAGQVSLLEVMTTFVDAQPWRHNTVVNARNAVEHVRAHFGDRPINRIRATDVQAFVASLTAKGLEPRTVQTVFSYARKAFRAAVDDGLIGRDPSARVKLPQHDGAPVAVPTLADVMELHDGAPDHFAVAIVLASGLGLRASEVAGLTIDRVNFLRREVTVDRQWHGQLDRFEPPKSKASNRTIPAGDRVLDALALHLEQHGHGEHGLVLHAAGRPMNANRMQWRWEQTVRDIVTGFTLHDLRHHFASSLISAGCSIVAVQMALGHAKPSTTLNTYAHVMPSDGERIRGAIDQAWRAVADQPRTEQPGATL